MTSTKNMIELNSCYFAHPEKHDQPLLVNLSHSFQAGDPTLITGETGTGKTTLIQILAALKRPTQGECLVNGIKVSRWTSGFRDQWRKKVGILSQQPLLLGFLTVSENITLPLMNRKIDLRDIAVHSDELMRLLNLLHLKDRKASRLSGGEAQRVELARACIVNPDFLFLDEPSSHQDQKQLSLVMNLIRKMSQKGAIIIAVSHDQRMHKDPFFKTLLTLSEGHLSS